MGKPENTSDAHAPLIYDATSVKRATHLVICVPGALTRLEIFDAVLDWRAQGWEPVFYPFPGLDGRALSPPLDIAEAADDIAKFARRYAEKRICLLGFSTGGAIVVAAAALLGDDVKTAAIAPALPYAGGWATMKATAKDLCASALRARSIGVRSAWNSYYHTLLVGRAGMRDDHLMQTARTLTAKRLAHMIYPDGGLLRAHARGLRRWPGPEKPLRNLQRLAFFVGAEDPVFSREATKAYAAKLGRVQLREYAGHGHLLFLTHPAVFDDVRAFFDATDAEPGKASGLSD
ncbi:alpha/beta hydrolase [Roseobacter sp.]|uniref:alpha/beta fold hydrolase n=1 Tax=Roseobacter sp. TaxID=1907202 RepID=UPI00296667C4|nr:alpha/beta hydrolase [Roseobacter sp.]MDW3181450.1 alpha/beta hydrolase [Roseobacter sp.]